MTVRPEFQEIFTGQFAVNGNKGKVIKRLRDGHSTGPRKYNQRRVFTIDKNTYQIPEE